MLSPSWYFVSFGVRVSGGRANLTAKDTKDHQGQTCHREMPSPSWHIVSFVVKVSVGVAVASGADAQEDVKRNRIVAVDRIKGRGLGIESQIGAQAELKFFCLP